MSNIEEKYKSSFTRKIIEINDLNKIVKRGDNHGLCGGHNLGNTCFMNSSIACLSNCTELTTYFLTKEFEKSINKSNKEGLGGKLAYAWYNLLKKYWTSDQSTGDPSELKHVISKKAKKFSGYSQQDSNEFMTEFLGILNEDLNIGEKTYKELDEKKRNETDQDCAKRFWDLHIKRNDSIITDLFCGLYKSTVSCPNCDWISVTFDPFTTLTVSIPDDESPKKQLNSMNSLFYIPKYNIGTSVRISINIGRTPLFKITEKLKTLKDFEYKPSKLKYISVVDKLFKNFIPDDEPVRERFIFCFDDNGKIPIPLYFEAKDYSAFPRLLFIEKGMKFSEFKKEIHYFARKYILNPTENEVDQELKKFIENKDTPKDDNILRHIDNEYNQLLSNKEFIDDFPYQVQLTKNLREKKIEILFDGKNDSNEALKELKIYSDNDSIDLLISTIEKEKLNLVLKFNLQSKFVKNDIKLDSCVSIADENFKKKETLTLEDCIDYDISEEQLTVKNLWLCKQCKKKVTATKKLELYYLPRLMIICLKRFEKSRYSYFSKNNEYIEFPIEDFDMANFVCGPDKKNSKYDLFAVSQHYGDTGGGHYTAVCKNVDGNWYSYNDSSCRISSEKEVRSNSAYVLFYRRKNW